MQSLRSFRDQFSNITCRKLRKPPNVPDIKKIASVYSLFSRQLFFSAGKDPKHLDAQTSCLSYLRSRILYGSLALVRPVAFRQQSRSDLDIVGPSVAEYNQDLILFRTLPQSVHCRLYRQPVPVIPRTAVFEKVFVRAGGIVIIAEAFEYQVIQKA